MRKFVAWLVGASSLATVWTAGSATGVQAAVLTCGQTITQSTVLENDVGPCPTNANHGIRIGADNITLDLNGHTVFGSAASGAQGVGEGAGIYLLGRTNVTVRNGTVRNFDGGVAIEGGSGNTVTGLHVHDNIGIVGRTLYADGIAVLSSQRNRIVANRVVHNGPLSGIGVYTRVDIEHPRQTSGVARDNLIDGNQIIDNNIPRDATINDDDGIRIHNDSVFNTVSNNFVSGSGLDGIAIFSFAPDNTIRGNSSHNNGFLNPFRRRGDGIRVFGGSDRTVVERNQVVGNAANGIILHGVFNTPSGPRPPVTQSRVTDNSAVGNNRLPPIEQSELGGPTFDLHDGNPNCDANVWLRNRYRTANPACTTVGGQQV